MNPKIAKLRTERERIAAKITNLQARSRKIDAEVLELENTDIIGLVRDSGMTVEQFAAIMQAMREKQMPVLNRTTEETL